jgi:hypothetical protein
VKRLVPSRERAIVEGESRPRPRLRARPRTRQLAFAEALEEAAREEDVTSVVVPSAPSSRSRVRRARPIERPAGESDDLTAARARKILKGHGFIARGR